MHLLMAAGDSGDSAPAWVTWVTLAGVIATALFAYLAARHTARVAHEANINAKEAAQAAATMDRREEWWKRAQWAMDRACDAAPRSREIGAHVLDALAQSVLAHQEEKTMIANVLVVIATTP